MKLLISGTARLKFGHEGGDVETNEAELLLGEFGVIVVGFEDGSDQLEAGVVGGFSLHGIWRRVGEDVGEGAWMMVGIAVVGVGWRVGTFIEELNCGSEWVGEDDGAFFCV